MFSVFKHFSLNADIGDDEHVYKVWKKAQWGQSTLLHFDKFEVFCVQPCKKKKPKLISLNCEIKSNLKLNELFILEMIKGQFPCFKIQPKLKNLPSTTPFRENASFLMY